MSWPGHLAPATCRFLVLLGDFDARRGWASREHVRVVRALRDLPVIHGEFAASRLSYAKVRALTRIASADT